MNTRLRTLIRTSATTTLIAALAAACAPEGATGVPGAEYEAANLPPVYDHQGAPPVVVIGGGEADEVPAPQEAGMPDARMTPEVEVGMVEGAFGVVPGFGRGVAPQVPPRDGAVAEAPAPSNEFKRFADGEICTYDAFLWGDPCQATGSCRWVGSFDDVLPSGLTLGAGDVRFVLSGSRAVLAALPGRANAAPMAASVVDPTPSQTNRLASEVAALALNLAYSEAGKMGTASLGQARVNAGPFAHWTIYGVRAFAERALTEPGFLDGQRHVDAESLADEIAALNAAGRDCVGSDAVRPAE